MFLEKRHFSEESEYGEKLQIMNNSESASYRLLAGIIETHVNKGLTIDEDVFNFFATHDFQKISYVEIIAPIIKYDEKLNKEWIELFYDVINTKEEDTIENFLTEVRTAFLNDINIEKIKTCLKYVNNPFEIAAELNDEQKETNERIIGSLTAVAAVIDKIEFNKEEKDKELEGIQYMIEDLKKKLNDSEEENVRLKSLLEAKGDLTNEEYNKLLKEKEFYFDLYNKTHKELNNVKMEKVSLSIEVKKLKKKLDTVKENMSVDMNVVKEVADDGVKEAIENVIASNNDLKQQNDSINENINKIFNEFKTISEGLKALDDNSSKLINNEIERAEKSIITNITSLVNNFSVSEDYSVKPEYVPDDYDIEPSDKFSNLNEDEKENLKVKKATNDEGKIDIPIQVPDEIVEPDIINSNEVKSDNSITDASNELTSKIQVEKINSVMEDDEKFSFMKKIKQQLSERRNLKEFYKIKDSKRKKQLILEKVMDNRLGPGVVKLIKEIFESEVVSLDFLYKTVCNKDITDRDIEYLCSYSSN